MKATIALVHAVHCTYMKYDVPPIARICCRLAEYSLVSAAALCQNRYDWIMKMYSTG